MCIRDSARAGKGKAGWADLWDQAWKEGARLLPAVWREYLQGAVWERFVILLFASIPTGFALIGITVFGLTVQRLVQLPGKLRARHEFVAQRAAAGEPAGAGSAPGRPKRAAGAPNAATAARWSVDNRVLPVTTELAIIRAACAPWEYPTSATRV